MKKRENENKKSEQNHQGRRLTWRKKKERQK